MSRKMLILLPDGKIHKISLPFFTMSFREAPLTATMLAALTPGDLGFDIRICDASVSKVPDGERFDLVAIRIITGTAVEGYRLADRFRAGGAAGASAFSAGSRNSASWSARIRTSSHSRPSSTATPRGEPC